MLRRIAILALYTIEKPERSTTGTKTSAVNHQRPVVHLMIRTPERLCQGGDLDGRLSKSVTRKQTTRLAIDAERPVDYRSIFVN